MAQQSDHSWTT